MKLIGIKASDIDNVATVFCELKESDDVTIIDKYGLEVKVSSIDDIPYGHKIAIDYIAKGNEIIKYGEVIGRAITDIELGDYVHGHNLESMRGRGDLQNE